MKATLANSAETAEQPLSEHQIQTDITRLLTFLSVLMLGLSVSGSVFPPDPVGLALTLLFFALLIMSIRRWTAALVLALVQIPIFAATSGRRDVLPTPDEMLLAFQVLLILGLISRLHSPVGHSSQMLRTLRLLYRRDQPRGDQQGKGDRARALQVAIETVRSFARQTFLLAIAFLSVMLLSSFLLQLFPLDPEFRAFARSWYRIMPTGFRLILIGFVLFVCVLVSLVIIAEVNFRRLSPKEASMYLRSQMLGWLHRDFRMIVRRHRRTKRKGK